MNYHKINYGSIGAIVYMYYPSYIKSKGGGGYAEERRKLYKQRHNKDRNVKGSNGYYDDKLLW